MPKTLPSDTARLLCFRCCCLCFTLLSMLHVMPSLSECGRTAMREAKRQASQVLMHCYGYESVLIQWPSDAPDPRAERNRKVVEVGVTRATLPFRLDHSVVVVCSRLVTATLARAKLPVHVSRQQKSSTPLALKQRQTQRERRLTRRRIERLVVYVRTHIPVPSGLGLTAPRPLLSPPLPVGAPVAWLVRVRPAFSSASPSAGLVP